MLSAEDKQAIKQLWEFSQPKSSLVGPCDDGISARDLGRDRLEAEINTLEEKLKPIVAEHTNICVALGKNSKFEALNQVLGMSLSKFLDSNRPTNLLIDVQKFDQGRLLYSPGLQLKFKSLR